MTKEARSAPKVRSGRPASKRSPKALLALLTGGDLRSIGRANQVVAAVLQSPRLFSQLVQGLWSADSLVRMRATDAVEKVSRDRPELLRPYKKELLGLMQETAGVLRGEADLRAEERASGAGTSKAVKKPEAVWSEATITKGERVLRGEADLRAEARASGAGTSKAVKKSEAVWSEATVTKGERLFRAEADLRAEARASGAGTSKAVKKPEAVWSEATITKEVRWHMAQISARLPLNARERRTAVAALRSYLEDRSSIVRTFALQALADLANRDADLRSEVIQLLHEATRSGTPAMKARSRKLLLRLEQSREEE